MPTARITRTWSSKYPTRAAAYHARTCRAFGAVRSSCRTKSCSHCILAYAALCFLSRQTSSPRPLQRLATSSRARSPRAAITRPTHRSRDSDTGYPYHARTHAILVEISISWCMPNGSIGTQWPPCVHAPSAAAVPSLHDRCIACLLDVAVDGRVRDGCVPPSAQAW